MKIVVEREEEIMRAYGRTKSTVTPPIEEMERFGKDISRCITSKSARNRVHTRLNMFLTAYFSLP